MNDQRRRPAIAELRAVCQPESVRGRKNAEHWSGFYMRDGSVHLTRLLVPTRITPNGVTGIMIVSGWCVGASLLIPGIWGPILAVLFGQLQMFLDAVDGELARWRQRFSPAGIFLDRSRTTPRRASSGWRWACGRPASSAATRPMSIRGSMRSSAAC